MNPASACPCGRREYARCCGPLHDGAPAATAEDLMRSRYSAYVRGDVAYLLRSWHPSTRPAVLQLEPVRWLGLDVRRHVALGDDRAIVEFVARCRAGGASAQRLHETSRFVREDGQWYYVDGDVGGTPR